MAIYNRFIGLTMPVFVAFGWAGEEAALNFALAQLELFIDDLYFSLPREIQDLYPARGLNKASHSVYLATNTEAESDLYIAFNARPMTLETSLAITDKAALAKAYKPAGKQAENFHSLVSELGPEWTFHVQQMEYNKESGEATHYQDLFKDTADKLDAETSAEVISRAKYLNSESNWVVPMYIYRRSDSEKVAVMGTSVTQMVGGFVTELFPLTKLLTGKVRKSKSKPPPKKKAPPRVIPEDTAIAHPSDSLKLEEFTYISELKSLHIKRGFVNLTPNHWPFFQINARTETRPVVVHYDEDKINKECVVWRLVPNDQARIVLESIVQEWMDENFHPDDQIQVTAEKRNGGDIHVTLNTLT